MRNPPVLSMFAHNRVPVTVSAAYSQSNTDPKANYFENPPGWRSDWVDICDLPRLPWPNLNGMATIVTTGEFQFNIVSTGAWRYSWVFELGVGGDTIASSEFTIGASNIRDHYQTLKSFVQTVYLDEFQTDSLKLQWRWGIGYDATYVPGELTATLVIPEGTEIAVHGYDAPRTDYPISEDYAVLMASLPNTTIDVPIYFTDAHPHETTDFTISKIDVTTERSFSIAWLDSITQLEDGRYKRTARITPSQAVGATGTSSYGFQISDGVLESRVYKAVVTVSARTDVPVGADTSWTQDDASETLTSDSSAVSLTDTGDHATLTVAITSQPAHGSVTVKSVTKTGTGTYSAVFTIEPNADGYPDPFIGVHTFKYTVSDDLFTSDEYTGTVTTSYLYEDFAQYSRKGAGYTEVHPTIPSNPISIGVSVVNWEQYTFSTPQKNFAHVAGAMLGPIPSKFLHLTIDSATVDVGVNVNTGTPDPSIGEEITFYMRKAKWATNPPALSDFIVNSDNFGEPLVAFTLPTVPGLSETINLDISLLSDDYYATIYAAYTRFIDGLSPPVNIHFTGGLSKVASIGEDGMRVKFTA